MRHKLIIMLLIVILNLAGCQSQITETEIAAIDSSEKIDNCNVTARNESDEEAPVVDEDVALDVKDSDAATDMVEAVEPIIELTEEELLEIYQESKVNELGQIMIVMYHNLSENEGLYARSVDNFKKDLQILYDEGYRPINMTELVTGNITVGAGFTPIVLTFDDGSKSNFYYDDNGDIAEDSVVGIMEAFSESHEGFDSKAIFYLNGGNPFKEAELIGDKFTFLIENGYEIGNHTYEHSNLKKAGSAELIQKYISTQVAFIQGIYQGYEVNHLSLPFGQRPGDDLTKYLVSGTYNDVSYINKSIVNVGWNPVKSPMHKDFNPLSLNRITCGEDDYELWFWIEYFRNNPEKRYISDGNSKTVVYPSSEEGNLKATEGLEFEFISY